MFDPRIESLLFLKAHAGKRKTNFASNSRHLSIVFLCGKEKSKGDNRSVIENVYYSSGVQFPLYSENVINHLSLSKLDYLTLEEFMLDISSGIVLLLESMGSACELGAFSLIDSNIEKMRVVVNSKYETDDSFLNRGPLAKIAHSFPTHVMYEFFNSRGVITFSATCVDEIKSIETKSFKRDPFSLQGSEGIIYDCGLFLRMLFDYVRMFGVLQADKLLETMLCLHPYGPGSLNMVFSSNNSLTGKQSEAVVLSLPEILCDLSIFESKVNRGKKYYKINYEKFNQKRCRIQDYSSLLFPADKMDKSMRREINIIRHKTKKAGFMIW